MRNQALHKVISSALQGYTRKFEEAPGEAAAPFVRLREALVMENMEPLE